VGSRERKKKEKGFVGEWTRYNNGKCRYWRRLTGKSGEKKRGKVVNKGNEHRQTERPQKEALHLISLTISLCPENGGRRCQ